jgi:hypothetical protein
MDLYFQGRAWLNKGSTAESRAQARGFFERALALDPGNVEALVGAAWVDVRIGNSYTTDDRAARFAAAEAQRAGIGLEPDQQGNDQRRRRVVGGQCADGRRNGLQPLFPKSRIAAILPAPRQPSAPDSLQPCPARHSRLGLCIRADHRGA